MNRRLMKAGLFGLCFALTGYASAQENTPPTTTPGTDQTQTAPGTFGTTTPGVDNRGAMGGTHPDQASMVDVNSASKDELMVLPGISDAQAQKIIDGRPYMTKDDLLQKRVLPRRVFRRIEQRINVTPASDSTQTEPMTPQTGGSTQQ